MKKSQLDSAVGRKTTTTVPQNAHSPITANRNIICIITRSRTTGQPASSNGFCSNSSLTIR
ncbi:MAG: hypothetical protein NTV46_02955 [Verrucomicrobia bacterium]|nr:hypothetical protein [Verrucomicrobiota bacterium]